MDVTDIEAGVDFVRVLQGAVGSCGVLLAVIGHDWLTCTDRSGRRRLDDDRDFIRLEIGTALARNVRVIPVLVEGAVMPMAHELPADLEALTRRQAVELRDGRWNADVESLTSVLDRVLAPKPSDGRSRVPPKGRPSRTLLWSAGAAAVVAALVASIAIASRGRVARSSAPPENGALLARNTELPRERKPVAPVERAEVRPATPEPGPVTKPNTPVHSPAAQPPPAKLGSASRDRGASPVRPADPLPGRSAEPSRGSAPATGAQPGDKGTTNGSALRATAQTKPVLVVHAFRVAEGVQWPYNPGQLQTETVAELKTVEDIRQQLTIVAQRPSDASSRVYALEGEVLSWQPGNRTKRIMAGFVAGRESAEIRYWIVDGSGPRVFERKDTIRTGVNTSVYASPVGQLTRPFVLKIAERLAEWDWPLEGAPGVRPER